MTIPRRVKFAWWLCGALAMRALDSFAHHHDLTTGLGLLALAIILGTLFWGDEVM